MYSKPRSIGIKTSVALLHKTPNIKRNIRLGSENLEFGPLAGFTV